MRYDIPSLTSLFDGLSIASCSLDYFFNIKDKNIYTFCGFEWKVPLRLILLGN